MAAETGSVIERIKTKLDIVDEIGAVVPLKKSGKAFKGLCPFHGERTPSFYVFPESGTWRCFGCNEGGDLFTFVEKQQGLDFPETLALLAERAGIALGASGPDGEPPVESAETSARKQLRTLNEAAAIWFHSQLLQVAAAQYARSYLESRGVSNESIALWRLGYAPEGDRLAQYLQEQGYSAKELVEAGLARVREADRGGGLYDYFRNRLIFPIRDGRGQTIAFGGRELGGGHPKYLNTPQTVLFDKSATLYGMDLARDAIRRQNRVVIVEGYMDALVTHQYGSRNVVAVIGSALTEKHVQQIKKLTRRVTLALDPDAAGESATVRGITVAQQAFDRVLVPVPGPAPSEPSGRKRGEPRGVVRFEEQVDAEITVARLPAGEDPDEFVRRDTVGWQRAIDEAAPLIDFLFDAQTSGLALDTPQGKLEACRRLLPLIAEVRSRTLASEYVDRLATKLRLDVKDLQRDLAVTRQRLDREARAQRPNTAAPREDEPGDDNGSTIGGGQLGGKYRSSQQEGASAGYSSSSTAAHPMPTAAMGGLLSALAQEEYCLGLLLEHPQTWTEMRAILDEGDFSGTETRALFGAITANLREVGPLTPEVLDQRLDALLRETAARSRGRVAAMRPQASEEDEEAPGLLKQASQAAYRLKRMRLKSEQSEVDYLIRDAEQSGEREALRALVRRKQHLLALRHTIDAATSLQA
jgi:DNA primase